MDAREDIERAVAACFTRLNPKTRSADGRSVRDRPDWLARVGPERWAIEMTAFRTTRAPVKGEGRPDEAAIRERLEAKAARIDAYRLPDVDRVGLIIHAEFGRHSCRLEYPQQMTRLATHAADVHASRGAPFDGLWLLRNERPDDRGMLVAAYLRNGPDTASSPD